jgi:hypothetical protein
MVFFSEEPVIILRDSELVLASKSSGKDGEVAIGCRGVCDGKFKKPRILPRKIRTTKIFFFRDQKYVLHVIYRGFNNGLLNAGISSHRPRLLLSWYV